MKILNTKFPDAKGAKVTRKTRKVIKKSFSALSIFDSVPISLQAEFLNNFSVFLSRLSRSFRAFRVRKFVFQSQERQQTS